MQSSLVFRVVPAPFNAKLLKAFRKDAGWPEQDDAASGPGRPGSRVVWATAQASGKTVGIARLELAAPQFCFVSQLSILSSHRGKGIGEWLVKNIESYCRGQDIPRILLEPGEGAHGFYDKLHFIPDARVAGFLKKELSPFQPKLGHFQLFAASK